MSQVASPIQRDQLVRLIEEGYDHKAWHGPNLKGCVWRVSAEQALWRPRKGRRNIAEITVHCAYWKYAVRRRIRGDKRGSFPLKGSNWFTLSARLTQPAWRDLLKLLDQEHAALLDTIKTAPWSKLTQGPGGSAKQAAYHVYGAAMHDVYHAGQIQMIKALYKQTYP